MVFKLLKLRVINAGPIKDLTINFCDKNDKPLDNIVIGGANGSGKTTILNIICELFELLNLCPDDEPNFNKEVEYAQLDFLDHKSPITIWYGIKPDNVLHNLNSLGYSYKSIVGSKRKEEGDLISELHLMTHRAKGKEIKCKDFSSIKLDEEILSQILFFPGFRTMHAITDNKQIFKEETKYQLVYKYDNIKQFEGSFQSYLIWLDYAEPETFERIIQYLNDLNFGGKTFEIDKKNLQVLVRTPKGETHLLHELSSGEQNLFILLAELRRRVDRPSIILIDEIENSLHQAYQYKVLDGLKELQTLVEGLQIIITTHSKNVFNNFPLESRRVITEF